MPKKYGIPKSSIQRTMSGKKEHKKGGKQYCQERKMRASEEGSIPEKKTRRSEPKTTETKTAQTPELEKEPDDDGSDSDELPDVKL